MNEPMMIVRIEWYTPSTTDKYGTTTEIFNQKISAEYLNKNNPQIIRKIIAVVNDLKNAKDESWQ